MSKTIAIIGAGQMGSGIAQTFAQNGMDVLLADVSLDKAEEAVKKEAEKEGSCGTRRCLRYLCTIPGLS